MIVSVARAKINLALVVGPQRADGKHEVLTVLQRLDLADRIVLEPADQLVVEGFAGDTLVHDALATLAARVGIRPRWKATIAKRIPVAAGLGGGSSDAAAALRLANATLPQPLSPSELHEVAAQLGADVPFFLAEGPQLGSGDGSELTELLLPQDYAVVIVIPQGVRKSSTADVYRDFDGRDGSRGFDERRADLLAALAGVAEVADLSRLPRNDLAASPVSAELERLGASRADVSGAGPSVYGLFRRRSAAETAVRELGDIGTVIVAVPAW